MLYDFIIIGGGLSGACFAHYAGKAGASVCILEKESVLGGCVRSVYPEAGSDYFVELGAHTIYRSYATMIEIINNTNKKADILPQTKQAYRMWADGQIKSLFSGVNFFKLALGGLQIGKSKHGHTVESYYTELFGTKNYKNLIHPATSAVICQDSTQVAADLLLKSRKKDKSYPRSFSLRGGLSTLVSAAVKADNIDVNPYAEVKSITLSDGIYTAKVSTGDTIQGRRLVMAVPADEAAKLLVDIYPKLAEILKRLPMKRSRAVGFCTSKANAQMPEFGYLIARDSSFTAVVSRDVLPDASNRAAVFHFKPSSEPAKDWETIRSVYNLKDAEAIHKAEAEFTLPQLGVMHYEWRRELESELAGLENFHLLGNFFDGLSMEDCLIRAKTEATKWH
jgi:protoporphyrinogen oxidase